MCVRFGMLRKKIAALIIGSSAINNNCVNGNLFVEHIESAGGRGFARTEELLLKFGAGGILA